MTDLEGNLLSDTNNESTANHEGPRLNILFIHENLPRPDRCGTDVKLMHVLRELTEQGHSVTYVARSGEDRECYTPALETMGIRVHTHDAARLRYNGVNDPVQWDFRGVLAGTRFDLAILYHWFWMPISISEHYIDPIRKWSPATRIAVLSDDQNALREEHLARASGLLSDHFRAADFRQREQEVYRSADLVLSDSDVDAREIGASLPGLIMGALTVTAEVAAPTKGFEQRNGVLYIGNFDNRLTTDGAKWLLKEIWPVVRRQIPGVNLFIAGNLSTSIEFKSEPDVHILGRVEDLGKLYDGCRVFAAPTRSFTGVQTKILQALRHGLPAVTTPASAERLLLRHGKGALLADETGSFADEVVRLHQSAGLWTAMSAEAIQHVRTEFSRVKLRSQVRALTASVPNIEPRRFDPNHVFSVLRVEKEFPECIEHPDPTARFAVRHMGYLRLGEELLALGKPAEAREQFLHVFPYVGSQIPQEDFFSRLLINLSQCDPSASERNGQYTAAARNCLMRQPATGPNSGNGKAFRTGKAPEISVVIPTYNRSAILASCLGALQHQSIEKDRYEVIVIDDGSTDATEELCRGFSAGFGFYYQRQQNRGAGAARNLGLNTAQGKYVLLVNDDTIASPTLLQEHLRAQASAAGKKLAVLGHFNYPAIAARRALTYLLSASPFLHPQVNMKKGLYHGMAYFIACNLSIEREAVLAAGSFDSQFRVAEGTEMGARMTCRGYQILYWPEAYAMHDHVNLRIDDFVRRARAYGPATLRLMQKHPSLLGDGGGLPGRLDRAGIIRTLDFLNNTRTQVTEALAVARRLDDFDFLPLLRGETEASKSLANAILGLLEKAVSQIHRFYLMEALVERLQDEELAPGDIKYSPQGRSDVLRPILEP